jgi:hypothetical protein
LIKEAVGFNHKSLLDLNLHLIKAIAQALNIKVNMVRSSEFSYFGKEKNEKLVSICKFMGADTYLSGSGGRAYIDEGMFNKAEIAIQWHTYEHPTYKQMFSDFQPNMSIIDLLFNAGAKAKEIILKGGVTSTTQQAEITFPKPLLIEQN